MDKPMFWADDDTDWVSLIGSQNCYFMEIDSVSMEQKKELNKASRIRENKSDQSFNSDSQASNSPNASSSCLYVSDHTTLSSQNLEVPLHFYFSPSKESFLTDQCAESEFEFLDGGVCSNCKTNTADTCIAHHQGRHLDVCMTCAAHFFKFRMPCPLCQLPIVYIYRYNNI